MGYFKNRTLLDEIKTSVINEGENLMYSNQRRRCGLSFTSTLLFAADLTYVHMIPDPIKYQYTRIFVDLTREPVYRMLKFSISHNHNLRNAFSNDSIEPMLNLWHSKRR